METNLEKNLKCGNCEFFKMFYTKLNGEYITANHGHCSYPFLKGRIGNNKACEKFVRNDYLYRDINFCFIDSLREEGNLMCIDCKYYFVHYIKSIDGGFERCNMGHCVYPAMEDKGIKTKACRYYKEKSKVYN